MDNAYSQRQEGIVYGPKWDIKEKDFAFSRVIYIFVPRRHKFTVFL